MNEPEIIPLSVLRAGQRACVEQVIGPPEDVRRMEEMGFRGGTAVEMLQPGSPCIVQLAGHHNKLCFRSGELLRILVRLTEA